MNMGCCCDDGGKHLIRGSFMGHRKAGTAAFYYSFGFELVRIILFPTLMDMVIVDAAIVHNST
jgi:hypothetical protein